MAELQDLTFRDSMSAGVQAATDSLNKLADAADASADSVEKISDTTSAALPNFTSLNKKLDESAGLAAKIESANRKYEASLASLRAEAEKNADVAANLEALEKNAAADRDIAIAKAQAYSDKLKDQRAAITDNTKAQTDNTASAGSMAFAQNQLRVQATQLISGIATGQPIFTALIQQGHQVVDVFESQGLGFANLGTLAKNLVAPFLGVTGAIVGTVAALGYLAYAAEQQDSTLANLQNTLRGTRDDYIAMATQATAAAKAVAATQNISSSDAKSAADAIAASPNFHGTQSELQNLITAAADLKATTGTTFEQFAAGLNNVGQFAQQLADKQFPGMTQALVNSIKQMQTAGDTGTAFSTVLAVIQKDTAGAINNVTPFQQALIDLEHAFSDSGTSGESWGHALGETVLSVVTATVNGITALVNGIQSLYDIYKKVKDEAQTNYNNLPPDYIDPITGLGRDGKIATGDVNDVPPGIRRNNPGNLHYAGQTGATNDNSWAQFQTMQQGVQALQNQLLLYTNRDGLLNVNDIIETYAPRKDHNDTTKYINDVSAQIGVDPRQNLNLASDPTMLAKLMQAIITNEVGGKYASLVNAPTSNTLPTPPIPPGMENSSGVYTTPQQNTNTAISDAEKANATAKAFADASAKVHEYQNALNDIQSGKSTATGTQINELREQLEKANAEMYNAVPLLTSMIRPIELNITANNNLADAYSKGAFAVAQVTAQNAAQAALVGKLAPGTQEYATAVGVLTQENLKLAESQSRIDFEKTLKSTDDQTDAQSRINAAWDGSAKSLSHLQDIEKAITQVRAEGVDPASDEYRKRVDALTNSFDNAAKATQTFQQEQASVNAVSSAFSSAFSTIGNAITQSFVSGQGAAVNWGNVVKSVISQVIQKVAELAILNPILNSLFGQNNGTLGTALAVFGQSGGVGGLASAAGGATGSTSSSGGLLSGLGNIYSAGKSIYSGISSILNGGVISPGIDTFASSLFPSLFTTGAPLQGPLLTGATLDTTVAPGLLGSASNLLGGVGGGFALGSLAGGFLQSALGKTGPAPTIGAGVGAAAGAAIGSIVPGIGTLVGGIVGGLLGGGGGGLIGPGKPNAYSREDVSTAGGNFAITKVLSQLVDTTAEVQKLQSQIDDSNSFINANGIQITSQNTPIQFGQNTPGKYIDPTKYADLYSENITGTSAFSHYGFTSSNADVQAIIGDKHFENLDQLKAVVTFIQDTVPALLALGKPTTTVGSLTTTLQGLNDEFSTAISTAANLGRATDDLNTAWQYATKSASDAVIKVFDTQDKSYQSRFLNAKASITGSAQDSTVAQLFAFDQDAQNQRDALKAQLISYFGDSVTTTQNYADQMAALENALGEERLAIQSSYNKQILSSAQSTVTSTIATLAQFTNSLQTSADSPLSPQAQLALARSQFNTDSVKAKGGDYNAIQAITGDATTLLNASKIVNGSGVNYVSDFTKVTDALTAITNLGPDALTASAMAAQMQTQTATLVASLSSLQTELVAIKMQLKSNASVPAQVS